MTDENCLTVLILRGAIEVKIEIGKSKIEICSSTEMEIFVFSKFDFLIFSLAKLVTDAAYGRSNNQQLKITTENCFQSPMPPLGA